MQMPRLHIFSRSRKLGQRLLNSDQWVFLIGSAWEGFLEILLVVATKLLVVLALSG